MTCCPHPPWAHTTVTYPRRHWPCNALICCDKPAKHHDGPGHPPKYCPCENWTPEGEK